VTPHAMTATVTATVTPHATATVTPHATAAVTAAAVTAAAVTTAAPIEILSHRLAAHPDFECKRKKK